MSRQNDSIRSFGVFELDLRTAELRKNGLKLRLQDQPYQVLVKLVEHPGEMVSREELRSALWHSDTFVDFETGLNTAIKRLRETLGDSADNPTFIETLPRRGYRFIAAVGPLVTDDDRSSVPNSPQVASAPQNHLRRIGFVAAIAVLTGSSIAYWRSEPKPPTVANSFRITNDGVAKNPMNPPVSDGVRLYFVEGMPDTTGSRLMQVPAAGGETSPIQTTLRGVWAVAAISPDRSELMVGKGVDPSSSELWIQPLPTGAPHHIGDIEALLGNWTPDGSHIVFPSENGIDIAKKDGSDQRTLLKVDGAVFSIRYSPDGHRIRFDLFVPKQGTRAIWEADSDGKNVHPLFPEWKGIVHRVGRWSPDGNYYYFEAGQGDDRAIWVLPEQHSFFRRRPKDPTRLASGPLHFGSPLPSIDGKRLFVFGEDPRVELLRYDQKAQRFEPYLSGLSAGPIDYSIDGNWMAYVSYPDMTLWRSRVDGSDKMQLTFPPARAYLPRWSPDGSQIVFMDVRFEAPWQIYLVSSSGGSPRALMHPDTGDADPTWTADGKSIVFGKAQEDDTHGIYKLDLETGAVSSIPDSNGIRSPRVSPNGRYIAACGSHMSKLMLFDTTTRQWSTLAEAEQLGYNEWSHNGKFIYFRESREGAAELVRVRVKDHTVQLVLSLRNLPQLDEGFAAWIGLTQDDAPLVMRNRSVNEFYALDLQFH